MRKRVERAVFEFEGVKFAIEKDGRYVVSWEYPSAGEHVMVRFDNYQMEIIYEKFYGGSVVKRSYNIPGRFEHVKLVVDAMAGSEELSDKFVDMIHGTMKSIDEMTEEVWWWARDVCLGIIGGSRIEEGYSSRVDNVITYSTRNYSIDVDKDRSRVHITRNERDRDIYIDATVLPDKMEIELTENYLGLRGKWTTRRVLYRVPGDFDTVLFLVQKVEGNDEYLWNLNDIVHYAIGRVDKIACEIDRKASYWIKKVV